MGPAEDKIGFFTIFLQREQLGERLKHEHDCTGLTVQSGDKDHSANGGENQDDYIDMFLVSSDSTIPLHVNFGAGSEI